jgi:hypothetical protein
VVRRERGDEEQMEDQFQDELKGLTPVEETLIE